jgi:hypothetical protein
VSGKKKLRNKLARRVLDGKITAAQGQAALRAAGAGKAAKQQAYQGLAAAASAMKSAARPAAPVTEQDLFDAAQRPMPRPVIRQVPQVPGQMGPQDALKALRAMTEKRAAPRPPQRWTAGQRALLDEIETNTDPVLREAYRTALYKERGGT